LADKSSGVGERSKVEVSDLAASLPEFKHVVKEMLERIVDTMKTSPNDIPVVLVGGGAFIAPDRLSGASKVVKPNWSGVANAIGAATARVSGVVDSVESTETRSRAEVMEELSQRAIDKAVANGALRDTVAIAEMESYPLQYISDKSRIIIKAVGDFDYSRTDFEAELANAESDSNQWHESDHSPSKAVGDGDSSDAATSAQSIVLTEEYIENYRPEVINRIWLISETDLEFITTGCYILGTGGGGNPYQHFLRLRESKRAGAVLRVISPQDLKDEDLVACGGAKGSPQVSIEKPYGDE
jgi:hypothetical protein